MENTRQRVQLGQMYKTIRISDVGIFEKIIIESNSLEDYFNYQENNYFPLDYDLTTRIKDIKSIIISPLNSKLNEFLKESYTTQGFSKRLTNCLYTVGSYYHTDSKIQLVGDIFLCEKNEMMKFRNFGKLSMKELQRWIETVNKRFNTNLRLGMTKDEINKLVN